MADRTTHGNMKLDGMYRDAFNTPLPSDKVGEYKKWISSEKARHSLGWDAEGTSYDLQGFWLKTGGKAAENGHFPDTWKKPNHPTFSNESIYHGREFQGGSWGKDESGKDTFTPGAANMQHMNEEEMNHYFNTFEKNVILNKPDYDVLHNMRMEF
jgi:hypothetical protein